MQACLEYLPLWRHKRAQDVQLTWPDLLGMSLAQLEAFETLDWLHEKIREALRKQPKTTPDQ